MSPDEMPVGPIRARPNCLSIRLPKRSVRGSSATWYPGVNEDFGRRRRRARCSAGKESGNSAGCQRLVMVHSALVVFFSAGFDFQNSLSGATVIVKSVFIDMTYLLVTINELEPIALHGRCGRRKNRSVGRRRWHVMSPSPPCPAASPWLEGEFGGRLFRENHCAKVELLALWGRRSFHLIEADAACADRAQGQSAVAFTIPLKKIVRIGLSTPGRYASSDRG